MAKRPAPPAPRGVSSNRPSWSSPRMLRPTAIVVVCGALTLFQLVAGTAFVVALIGGGL